jgi:hypothetical protein
MIESGMNSILRGCQHFLRYKNYVVKRPFISVFKGSEEALKEGIFQGLSKEDLVKK